MPNYPSIFAQNVQAKPVALGGPAPSGAAASRLAVNHLGISFARPSQPLPALASLQRSLVATADDNWSDARSSAGDCACECGAPDMCECGALEGYGSPMDLVPAQQRNSSAAAAAAPAAGADRYANQWGPLHCAVDLALGIASNAGLEALRELIACGSLDVDAVEGEFGWTPLHLVAYMSAGTPNAGAATRAAAMLLDGGACINLLDDQGKTALAIAAGNGCLPLVQFLLREGASVHIGNTSYLNFLEDDEIRRALIG